MMVRITEKPRAERGLGLAALLSTLAETTAPGEFAPQGPMYMVFMGRGWDLEGWQIMLEYLEQTGYITKSSETVTLTDKGRKKGLQISALLTENKVNAKA